mgnify:CR=1 FL=1
MIISKYTNGNCKVVIYDNGTKTREFEGTPYVDHPETIDVKITDYCDLGCSFCFLPSSKVQTPNGILEIQDVKIGGIVYSKDLKSGSRVESKVLNIFSREISEEIYEFLLENDDIIRCTGEHKLYTKNRGWVKAKDLKITDSLDNF